MPNTPHHAAQQAQFLEVIDREEATKRFQHALNLQPLGTESIPLAHALQRVLAEDVLATVDVPGFDRASVDGFALQAADTFGASDDTPHHLALNQETLTPGRSPNEEVLPKTATTIATGGMLPRGADAVMMIEDTEFDAEQQQIEVHGSVAAGQFIAFAGSDVAQGETVLRRGQQLTSREIGILAALGIAEVTVFRRPKVAIFSTGDELIAPGSPFQTGKIYDSNSAIVAAAVTELGCEAVPLGIVGDDFQALQNTLNIALQYDAVILSGGTSKGAGDLSYRAVSQLNDPGIVAHGVALKPGKPICLAVTNQKPVVILPGFPTSAIFTFHEFVAPVLRRFAGLPIATRQQVNATLPMKVHSERGRTEYLLVSLMPHNNSYAAYPMGKNSGSVSTFSYADGFITIDQHTELLPANTSVTVQLLSQRLETADLVVIGSHCLGLDYLLNQLQQQGWRVKMLAVGSMGGLTAAKRGECDLAGIHLLDPESNTYNSSFLNEDLHHQCGYGRMQGLVFRPDDARFAAQTLEGALHTALSDPSCLMVNRNSGSGTRILIDQLLKGQQPAGYALQTKSHNAVATAIVQQRADWGVAIEAISQRYGLGFIPLTAEQYDWVIPKQRLQRPAIQAFLDLLQDAGTQQFLREKFGFEMG